MREFAARVSRVRMHGGASVTIIQPRANDISAKLREMARQIERGEHGDVGSMVAVIEGDAGVEVYGWGNIDGLRAIGVMSLGIQQLNGAVLSYFEDGV